MDQALKAVHVKFIAEQVLWYDSHDNARGPATVTEVNKDGLRILDHATQLYYTINPKRAEIIEFKDEEFLGLPQILQDEIAAALEWGKQCSHADQERCTDRRLYGTELCEQHSDPDWPYVDRAELEDWI